MKNKFPIQTQTDEIEWLLEEIDSWPDRAILETVSEWAERTRTLGSGLTNRPGKVDFSITPHLREIADNLSESSPIQEVYVIKSTQQGGTVMVLENHIGYCIEYGIGPILSISGDAAMAEEQMEKRVDEMVHSSGLSGRIRPNIKKAGGKLTGDRMDSKSYAGTFMRAVGPNSESKLRQFPTKILHFDEMDVYPLQLIKNGVKTGDPFKKAERRTDSYEGMKKICGISTPKNAGSSRIAAKVGEGDMRFYNIRCPSCDIQHPLIWENFKYEKTTEGKIDIRRGTIGGVEVIKKDPTYFSCPGCNYKLRELEGRECLQELGHGGTAEWISTKISDRPFIRSYADMPAWIGFRSWLSIAVEWESVRDDPFLLPDFYNDVIGRVFEDNLDKPHENELLAISQEYELWNIGTIKKDVILLTLSADIQKDRIEAGLIGWGRNRQGFMIDYWTFKGDTGQLEDDSWVKLSEKIMSKYVRDDGQEIHVQIAFIDSQYLSSVVDLFCEQFPYNDSSIAGVYPIQSRETQNLTVKEFSSNIKTPVIGLHDQGLKRALYNILRKRPQGFNSYPNFYLHFSHEYGAEFYNQLTSEEIVPVRVAGVVKGFKILNTKQRRNEVLDIVKMNMGALQYAIDRFFKNVNRSRKEQKRAEIQENIDLFFDYLEENLYE